MTAPIASGEGQAFDEQVAQAFAADLITGTCNVARMEADIAACVFRPATVAAFREAQRRTAMRFKCEHTDAAHVSSALAPCAMGCNDAALTIEEQRHYGRSVRAAGGTAVADPASAEERSGCPCTLITPCSPMCTCANPVMSGGCQRCALYGSREQRIAAASRLASSEEGFTLFTENAELHKEIHGRNEVMRENTALLKEAVSRLASSSRRVGELEQDSKRLSQLEAWALAFAARSEWSEDVVSVERMSNREENDRDDEDASASGGEWEWNVTGPEHPESRTPGGITFIGRGPTLRDAIDDGEAQSRAALGTQEETA